MFRLLLAACAFALLFSACSKEVPDAPQEEEFEVTLHVNALSHDLVPIMHVDPGGGALRAVSAEKNLSDAFYSLHYAFFNERGTRVVERSMYGPDFGKLRVVLTKGTYKVMVWGSAGYVYTPPWTYNDDTRLYSYELTDEIFFDQFDLIVSDTKIDQQVHLKRKVGNLEVEFTDKIPGYISEIRCSIEGVSDWFAPKTNRADNKMIFSRSIHFQPDETSYHEFRDVPGFYFFLDRDQETMVKVKLVALDQNKRIVVEKTVENVPVNVNRKTKVRGSLFENSSKFHHEE